MAPPLYKEDEPQLVGDVENPTQSSASVQNPIALKNGKADNTRKQKDINP